MHFRGERTASIELPAGRYALTGILYTVDDAGYEREATAIADPELLVAGDRTVSFDGRAANPLRIETPDRAVPTQFGLAWQRTTATRSVVTGTGLPGDLVKKVYVLPSRPATTGTFTFVSAWSLAAPVLTAEVPGVFRLADPRAIEPAPRLDGAVRVPIADRAEKGAAVLLTYTDEGMAERLAAASAAGARVILLTADRPGFFFADANGATVPVYAIEHGDAVRLRQRMAAGPVTLDLTGTPESPFRYDLVLPARGRMPSDVDYSARDLALATVDTEFHGHAATLNARDERGGFIDGIPVAMGFGRAVTRVATRVDHVNTAGVTWRHEVTQQAGFIFGGQGTMNGLARTYRPGERAREVWFPALTRPAIPDTTANYSYGSPVNRAHDAIRVAVPQYADGAAGEYGWLDFTSDRARLTLRQNGRVVGETTAPYTQFTVAPGDARFALTLDVARDDAPWWTTSTATSTTWTFRSATPRGDDPVVLPLLQIGYDLETDLNNAVRADRPYALGLRPGYQPGARGSGRIDLEVSISYDDGKSWRCVPVFGRSALMPAAPRGATFATVRVTARDGAGNTIEQTITRAWKIRA